MKYLKIISLLLLWHYTFSQKVEWAATYPNISESVRPILMSTSDVNRIAVSGLYGISGNPEKHKGIFVYVTGSTGNLLYGDTLIGRSIITTGQSFDQNNNLYVCGTMLDTLYDGVTLFKGRSFIAKYSSSGQKVWLKIFPRGQINDVSIDPANRLNVLATFQDTATFFNQTFQAYGPSNVLVLRIDAAGNIDKSKKLTKDVSGVNLSVTANGNYVVFAKHLDTLSIGSFTQMSYGDEPNYAFLAKLDSNLNLLKFNFTNHGYGRTAEHLAIGIGETMAVSGFYQHKGIFPQLDIFDPAGNLYSVSHPNMPYGLRDAGRNAKIAFTGNDELWSFHTETHYKDNGNASAGDSSWTNLALNKIGLDYKLLLNYRFELAKGSTAISGDQNGAIYIASTLPSSYSLNLQGLTLTNFNSSTNKLFIAKFYDDGNYVGLNENKIIQNNTTIFPNPAMDIVTIRFKEDRKINTLITIENSLGQVVYSIKTDQRGNEINLNVHNLPLGVYFIKIEGSQSTLFVKE